ncbi:MAG: phosphotransferase [Anaerolineaceae bacterium]|nr:phosphotransferase [Anaerolineaceae bacterium]
MKPFYSLTEAGQTKRLRKLAFKALQQYNLNVKRLNLITKDTHTIFRVDTEIGEKFALRIYSEGETSLEDNQVEMFFLNQISTHTDLPVPEPVTAKNGELITFAQVPDVPEERRCVLFRWVPGHCLEDELSTKYYFQLGQQMARLHDFAKTIQIPSHLDPRQWDQVFYYRDEPVVLHDESYSALFTPQRLEVIEKAMSMADNLFNQLYARTEGKILIHADLHFWNVHVYRGKIYLLDFEDALLGYPLQDIAVTLSYGRTLPEHPDLCAAFKEGYSSQNIWPVETQCQLETLWMARSIMFINYVAHTKALEPEPYINDRCADLKKFLDRCGS